MLKTTPGNPELRRRKKLRPSTSASSARPFGWSGVALAVIVVMVTGGLIYSRRTKPKAPPQVTADHRACHSPHHARAEIPKVKFTDVTGMPGIDFTHFNAASPEKLLPETMGGGVAFFDFDNDGDQDLFFSMACAWPWAQGVSRRRPTSKLYANDGTGKFSDVTQGSGLDAELVSAWAQPSVTLIMTDWVDVFVTCVGANRSLQEYWAAENLPT